MSEDSNFNRGQKKEEESGKVPDFSGSLGNGMLAKEKIETLGNSSGLTPLGFGVNVHNKNMDRENNELKRTDTNSSRVSSFGVRTSSLLNCSDQYTENSEMGNSQGLSTLHPFDEIHSIKKKSVSLIQGFSNTEDLETLKNSSGLTPLNYDSEPPMDADKRRNSPQKMLRTQSPGLTNFANNGE
ncbi:MAG: hypothetical protein O8C61_03035 [Candidatus Methanoperedens sp.]|nr:hypothetical protein [Candidatus Methanoperedens sp.]